MSDEFVKVELAELPKDTQGRALVDLYVHMPSANRYVRYIAAGDEIEERKLSSLKQHASPELFRRDGSVPEAAPPPPEPELPQDFRKEVLGKALQKELEDVYIFIKGDAADPGESVKRFEGMSDKLMGAIAPDVKTLNDHLKKQAQYLSLMSDAAAISTLAVICAYANGFDSRKSYRELSFATLVMDIALAEFGEEQIKLFYVDRDALAPDTLRAMLMHPMRSYQLAEQKLRSLSDVTMQLILSHHELFNGKGYPRGIRTEGLFPIARVLALAVDLFEHLKRAEAKGAKSSLTDILVELRDEAVEPHLRRHNKKLIDATLNFLSTPGATAPAAPTVA